MIRSKFLRVSALIVIFVIALISPFKIVQAKSESNDWEQELNNSMLEQLEALDTTELEEYLKQFEDFQGDTLKDRLLEYIKGGGMDYNSFFQSILYALFAKVKQLLPFFACVAAIAILCGMLNTFQTNYLGDSTARIVFFVAYLGSLIPIFSVVSECIASSYHALSSMRTQINITAPIMLTLMAASGGSASVAIYKPSVVFFSNILVGIIEQVVFPLAMVILVFSMLGRFWGELKLEKFTAFFKSINKWVLGVGVSIFAIFFTLQGITAASYDGIARRAAKYAIGTGVPIVGGFLAGGFDLAVAGSVLIKNSLGNFSLILLIFILLEPLTLLIASNLLLKLTAAVAHPFGEGKIASFLEDTAEHLNYFLAGLLFVAFLYFIVILLLTYSSEILL